MLFFIKETHDHGDTFNGHWAGPNRCCLLSKLSWRHQNSIKTPSKLHTQQVHPEGLFSVFIFIHFYYFSYSYASVPGWFLCLLMSILFCLFCTYIWNIKEWCPFTSVWFVKLCDSSPYQAAHSPLSNVLDHQVAADVKGDFLSNSLTNS